MDEPPGLSPSNSLSVVLILPLMSLKPVSPSNKPLFNLPNYGIAFKRAPSRLLKEVKLAYDIATTMTWMEIYCTMWPSAWLHWKTFPHRSYISDPVNIFIFLQSTVWTSFTSLEPRLKSINVLEKQKPANVWLTFFKNGQNNGWLSFSPLIH